MKKFVTWGLLPVIIPIMLVGMIGLFISEAIDTWLHRMAKWRDGL